MYTANNRKKKLVAYALEAAAAALAAPTLLFLGTGTAAATPVVNPFPDIGFGGATIHVLDVNGQDAWCGYHAVQFGGGGVYDSLPFFLGKDAQSDVVIWPAIPAGHQWTATVDCHYPGGISAPTSIQF